APAVPPASRGAPPAPPAPPSRAPPAPPPPVVPPAPPPPVVTTPPSVGPPPASGPQLVASGPGAVKVVPSAQVLAVAVELVVIDTVALVLLMAVSVKLTPPAGSMYDCPTVRRPALLRLARPVSGVRSSR